MSGAALQGRTLLGRTVLVIERDDARAGQLIMALRALGAQGIRWSDDERGRSQARSLRPDVVLVDAGLADDWAQPALLTISLEPALASSQVVRTDAARLWVSGEAVAAELERLMSAVPLRADRDTKPLRAVVAPEPSPKAEVGASVGARKITSARSTDKYGAVAVAPMEVAPPPVLAPAVLAAPAKPAGYVFPTRRGAEVEAESSSKATSLDLTAVPSSILDRANLPDTDRFERTPSSRPWLPWAIGAAVVLSVLALLAAFVTR